MDEYLIQIAGVFFLIIAIYLVIRAKIGRRGLIKYLDNNGIDWIDIHWVVPKVGKIFTLGSLSILYEVILKSGQIELYLVGSWWSGLLDVNIRKID